MSYEGSFAALPTAALAPGFPFPARPRLPRSRLALGPDFPRADQLYPGYLGYSAIRILTLFSLLIPAFSLQEPPPLLPVRLL